MQNEARNRLLLPTQRARRIAGPLGARMEKRVNLQGARPAPHLQQRANTAVVLLRQIGLDGPLAQANERQMTQCATRAHV